MTTMVYETLRRAVDADRAHASPGLRFGLYYDGWENFQPAKTGKREALRKVCELNSSQDALVRALTERQRQAAALLGEKLLLQADRFSQGPFVTGVGLEHPLENGFSFLTPYGLPYLPGSGVKGVVRRAAEELALFEPDPLGWNLVRVWWLFGFDENSAFFQNGRHGAALLAEERAHWREAYLQAVARCPEEETAPLIGLLPDRVDRETWKGRGQEFLVRLADDRELRRKVHLRGSLGFWDVFPEPAGRKLRVDIMNPHFGHYYQAAHPKPPGDWGSPNPIFFLTIPPGSRFHFSAESVPTVSLPAPVSAFAATGVEGALDFAFKWLGFGAKTSLGYGLMGSSSSDASLPQAPAQRPAGSPSPTAGGDRTAPPPARPQPVSASPREPVTTKPVFKAPSPEAVPEIQRKDKGTLVTAVKGGKARVRLEDGTELDASGFPAYPGAQAGARCVLTVTIRQGKAIKAAFKHYAT